MADVTSNIDAEHAAVANRNYLIRFEEDTLRQRPLWIRLIIEFLGTGVLVTVAAGSGVINQYVGGGPISRTAAVIAPGAVAAALFLQAMYGHVSAGGTYPIDRPGGEWRSFVMEMVLTAILVSIIL